MNLKPLLVGSALLALLTATGCNDNDDIILPAENSSTQRVDQLASNTSEDDEPFAINDGAFEFNDTREDSDSAAIF